MKFKLFSLILLGFLLVGIVSAGENISYLNESETISFEGMQFTIPEGFGQSNSEEFTDLGSDGQTCFYINENNDEIAITVISDWMGMSLDELYKDGAVKSSIDGHKGWKYSENGLHYFGYVQDGKGILVGTSDQSILNKLII